MQEEPSEEHWKRWVECRLTRHAPALWFTLEGPLPDPRPSQANLPEALRLIYFLFRALFRSPWRQGALALGRHWRPLTQLWGLVARCGSKKRTPGTCVSATSWRREARYRRASEMGRWVRAGQGSTACSRPTRVHLHAHLSAGARMRVPCGRRPAWSRGGPCIALHVNTRGFIAPATAARGLRACARCPGLLCYSRQACLARPAGYSALPRIALQPGHTPSEPAACCARGRSPSADATRSWVSACSSLQWQKTEPLGTDAEGGKSW